MDIRNNPQITNTTKVIENPTQTNTPDKNKRYTTAEIANKQHITNKLIEDVVICTKNEGQKQQIIDFYNRQYHASTIVKLDNNNDLNDNDLLNVITCKQAGNIEVTTGRLFNDEPLLLIIDLTTMDSGEIASLNDLLSVPATYNGNLVSNNVKIAIIIDEKMLTLGINKPSADLWRRLAKFNFYNSVDNLYSGRLNKLQQSILNKELLTTQIQPIDNSPQNKESTIINFASAHSWQELLFGSLTLDDKGKVYFKNGYLSNITNNNFVLHDAPWDNDEFTDALATTLRQGGFRANGSWVTLPENLLLTRSFTTEQQLAELTKKHVIQAEAIDNLNNEPFAIINSHNLESVLVNNQLQDGIVIAIDTLAILTADCNYLLITEELTKEQWLNLLNRVSALGDNAPKIIDASNSSVEAINKLMPDNLTSTLQCKTYQHKVEALSQLNNQGLVYQITPDTNWLDIWQNISLTSQENFTFATQDTELLTAIKQGKQVSFYGLETNPQILQQFESLLVEPSYLFLNGNKIPIANNNICLLLPENIDQVELPKLLQSVSKTEIIKPITKETNTTEFIEYLLEKLAANNVVLAQDNKTLSDMFIKQLEIERQQDKAKELLPIHYRKAAHNVFAKQHRDNPAFYSYLKTQINSMMADDFYTQAVDAEALRNWIKQNPNANRNSLARDFWLLARYCSPSCFLYIEKDIEKFKATEVNDKEMIDKLANIMLSVVADDQKQKLVIQFNITKDDTNKYISCYNGSVVSTITDAMLIVSDKLKTNDPISEVAKDYVFNIYQIIQNYPQKMAIKKVYELLLNIFPEDILQTEFSDLASAIVTSQVSIPRKQARKKQRLAARIKQHPIIFLQGLAGAGKSHMAQAVVTNLKNSGYENMPEPLVLSLGPQTKASDLFGTQQLQHVNDDTYTEFVAGPILQWAMSDNPPLLILDEANLVEDGVLAPLAGLTNSPPQLSYAGKVYRLSEKHRIIITGNPENYDGRHMDSAISATMLTLHYKAMTDTELAELIIKPALTTDLPENITAEITKTTLYLYNEYSKFIANDLGPRDLQDILARINRIIDHHGTNIKSTQVYSLVWESFAEILTSSVNNKTKQKKIFDSYKTKFAIDKLDSSILLNRDKKFEYFFNQLADNHPELDLSSIAVKKLVKDYWLFIDSQSNLQGRRGLWVEGPAGWGKDVILTAVLGLWEQQEGKEHKFIHINANPNQYDKTQKLIADAMQHGKKVIISEINLLPSRYLEGLFNAILTGKASSGFMLFATVNPSSYSNREQLSPAFMNRMTQVKLEPISNNELYKILLRRYPLNKPMVDWLFMNYLDLATALKQQQAPNQLSLANLLETAAKLEKEDVSSWLEIFQQDYGLAILMVKDRIEELTVQTPTIITIAQLNIHTNNTTSTRSINKDSNNSNYKTVEFNNITQAGNLCAIQYFATDKLTTSNYRLKLYKPIVTPDKILKEKIAIASEQIEILSTPAISNSRHIKLDTGQLLGTAELELSHNKWVALPGVSYHDQCIGISHTDLIELGRCKATGMLVVKFKEEQNSPQKIKLDFIIKPNLISLNNAIVVDDIEAPYQDAYLKTLLDEKIFSPNAIANSSIKELQQIKLITNKKQQIKKLIAWAKDFKDDMDITSKGADALIDAMRYKAGYCQHSSIAFQILAEYFGIPTNCIGNDLHMFVEFSLDNKQTWISVDLGSADNPNDSVTQIKQKFLDHQQAESNKDFNHNINYSDEVYLDYFNKIKYLQTQPDQLIRFLRYISSVPIYATLSQTELYSKDFYKYVNSTTDIFSEVLPNIFRKLITAEYDTTKFIYLFFACTYKQFQQGKIPGKTAKSILCTCLPLLEDNVLYTSSLLGVVEYLAKDEQYKNRAEKILTKYYSDFKTAITLDTKDINAEKFLKVDESANAITRIPYKSQTLARLLKQTTIKTDWSYTSTSKPPKINRLALRKPAFPINTNQQNNEVNVYVQLVSGEYYSYLCSTIFDNVKQVNPNKFNNITNFTPFFYSFIIWLFEQLSDFKLNFLLDNNRTDHRLGLSGDSIGYITYDNTRFNNYFYVDIFKNSLQEHDYIIGKSGTLFSDLNPNRIKQVFGNSAVVITTDVIEECFEEFLELYADKINSK
jgi:MoxR-like ATPase